ncbi:hypothetical protein EVAR_84257_1 [Eumeta japonica]|uniref:Uncharacterized protein n=1 Tax=Eumeta variegata TaxID=151549 RepID=A0A4C1WS33_EUMVA|nr:hypothetical protein EVAR_84257_1 [Eumeta japonica]
MRRRRRMVSRSVHRKADERSNLLSPGFLYKQHLTNLNLARIQFERLTDDDILHALEESDIKSLSNKLHEDSNFTLYQIKVTSTPRALMTHHT